MNSAVSTPSRPTARNASVSTATPPVSSARAISPRSSPDRPADAFFIQSTIVVTITTATSDAMPAIASAARPVMVFSPNWMTRNTATVMAIAAPTPSQTHLRASRRSDLTRKATRMVTTIAASRPSRRPIRPLPKSCDETLGPAARTEIGQSPTTVINVSLLRRAAASIG